MECCVCTEKNNDRYILTNGRGEKICDCVIWRLFCLKCVKQWLETNHSCPICCEGSEEHKIVLNRRDNDIKKLMRYLLENNKEIINYLGIANVVAMTGIYDRRINIDQVRKFMEVLKEVLKKQGRVSIGRESISNMMGEGNLNVIVGISSAKPLCLISTTRFEKEVYRYNNKKYKDVIQLLKNEEKNRRIKTKTKLEKITYEGMTIDEAYVLPFGVIKKHLDKKKKEELGRIGEMAVCFGRRYGDMIEIGEGTIEEVGREIATIMNKNGRYKLSFIVKSKQEANKYMRCGEYERCVNYKQQEKELYIGTPGAVTYYSEGGEIRRKWSDINEPIGKLERIIGRISKSSSVYVDVDNEYEEENNYASWKRYAEELDEYEIGEVNEELIEKIQEYITKTRFIRFNVHAY